jgi:acylphosphatase
MKKFICLILIVIFSLSLCACSKSTTRISGATEDEANYPTPVEDNYEESENSTGLRYNMTLWDYTTSFNLMYSDLGGGNVQGVSFSDWVLMKENQKDENGITYNYYYYNNGKVVLTATVETESEKVMNLGCGTTVARFTDSASAQQETMTLCGIMAAVAGGYESEAVTFFDNLFVDTINKDDNCFWYNNSVYMLSTEDGKDDEESTMLFRTMPVSESIRDKWNLQDYQTYWQGETN